MNSRIIVTVPFLLIVFAGCVSTRVVLIDPTAAPLDPVPPANVRILTTEAELATLDYVRVAIIEASGSGEYTSQASMIEAMRRKAGALGANALLLPQIQEPGAGAKVAGAIFGVGTERKGNVIAIWIRGPKRQEDDATESP